MYGVQMRGVGSGVKVWSVKFSYTISMRLLLGRW